MRKAAFGLVLIMLVQGPAAAGGIKKWVDADGKVHFGDAPPAGASTERIVVKPAYESTGGAAAGGGPVQSGDYYSPQNQLERMNERKQEALKRQEARQAADRKMDEHAVQQKIKKENVESERKKNEANCEYYTARVKEYEHRVRGGYKNKTEKLEDESHLGLLKSLKAKYCY